MRTTVRLDSHLVAEAKKVADSSGRTLTAVIEDALRESFGRRRAHGMVSNGKLHIPRARSASWCQPGRQRSVARTDGGRSSFSPAQTRTASPPLIARRSRHRQVCWVRSTVSGGGGQVSGFAKTGFSFPERVLAFPERAFSFPKRVLTFLGTSFLVPRTSSCVPGTSFLVPSNEFLRSRNEFLRSWERGFSFPERVLWPAIKGYLTHDGESISLETNGLHRQP